MPSAMPIVVRGHGGMTIFQSFGLPKLPSSVSPGQSSYATTAQPNDLVVCVCGAEGYQSAVVASQTQWGTRRGGDVTSVA